MIAYCFSIQLEIKKHGFRMMDNFCSVITLTNRIMYRSLYSPMDVFFKSFPAQKNTLA